MDGRIVQLRTVDPGQVDWGVLGAEAPPRTVVHLRPERGKTLRLLSALAEPRQLVEVVGTEPAEGGVDVTVALVEGAEGTGRLSAALTLRSQVSEPGREARTIEDVVRILGEWPKHGE
jgi:hypothetical protein